MPFHEDAKDGMDDATLRTSLTEAGVPRLPDAGAFDDERWRTTTRPRRRRVRGPGWWGYAAAAAVMAAVGLATPHLFPRPAATPAPRSHVTRDLDLVLGEGPALQQHTVPLRLPLSLEPLDAPTSSPSPRSLQYPSTLVVSHAWAPSISGHLLTLPVVSGSGPIPTLPAGEAFPGTSRVPGYAVILGNAVRSNGLVPAGLLAHTKRLHGSVLAFIGEPSSAASPLAGGVTLALASGLTGHFYTAKPVDAGYGHQAVPAVLLTWTEGADTYAVYSAGFINPLASAAQQQAVLADLARSMSQSLITRVTPLTVHVRRFNDANVMWTTPQFHGVLETETVAVRAPGTPGYRTLDGLGVRITQGQRPTTATSGPAWPSPSPNDPVPVLAGAVPYLSAVHIPVRLPSYVPLQRGLWPRLTVNAAPNSYAVDIRETGVHLAPNTPYAVGLGLGSWVGTVEGSRRPIALQALGPVNAPTVPARQVTGAWMARYYSKGYYLGTVILPGGLRVQMFVDVAGDGDHTAITFHQHGTYYEVTNYHSARMALRMAESMVLISPPGH